METNGGTEGLEPEGTGKAVEQAAAKAPGFVGRFTNQVKHTFGKSGAPMKFARVVGTGAGVIIVGKGLKDMGRYVGMAAPQQDETGKDITPDFGTLIKGTAEVVGGGALAYASLATGKGKAI